MKKFLFAVAAALLVVSAAHAQVFGTLWDGKQTPGFASNGLAVGSTTFTGVTGSGNLVGATSPTLSGVTLTTPILGAATATSLTFSPTTGGIVGTTTNDAASAGTVGELLTSAVAVGSHVSLSTGTAANMTSLSITAGDWDVWCLVVHELAATTTATILSAGISTTTATVPAIGTEASAFWRQASAAPGGAISQMVGPIRVSVATPTTHFCAVQDTFAVSTNFTYGVLRARRVR